MGATYKGYELRRTVTKFEKSGEQLSVETCGIYRNGDFKGSAITEAEARACIDQLTAGTLYRPRERGHEGQVTEYDARGNIAKTKKYRG